MSTLLPLRTNLFALKAQRRLAESSDRLQNVFERLSSGQRINRASDDAAGLAIAASLNVDTRVFTQAIRNVNDAVSLLNIEDGAITELTEILIRQRELATQAANGTFSAEQRRSLNLEANALVDEYNRIIESTEFNGIKLIDGSFNSLRVQAGYGLDGSIAFNLAEELARTAGDGTFGAETGFAGSGGGRANDVVLTDLNGDGILDAVLADPAQDQVEIFLGDGTGGFGTATSVSVAGSSPWEVVTGDFNGDGIIDIASGSYSSTNVDVFLGNGDGTFGSRTTFTAAGATTQLATGDFNGDGITDIVAADGYNGTGRLSILLGDGSGGFTAGNSTDLGTTLYGVQVGDFNGDGIDDITTVEYYGNNLVVLIGEGGTTFGTPTNIGSGGGPVDPVIADFNNDGYADIAVGSLTGQDLSVVLGNGDGTFSDATTYSDGLSIQRIAAGDLNGDGIVDLAYGVGANVRVRIGNGDGTFQDSTSFSTGGSALSIALGDLDGDDVLDVVTANYSGSDMLSVLIGDTQQLTTAQYLNLYTREGALEAMGILDDALTRVSSERGAIGSTQSRLEVASNVLSAARENSAAARGRILDADIAQESSELVRVQILQNAASAVLGQANLMPELVLRLLQ